MPPFLDPNTDRRLVLLVTALLASGAVAGCLNMPGENGQGIDALLSDGEIPDGLHNCEASAELRGLFGIGSNPGEVDIDLMMEAFEPYTDNTTPEDEPVPDGAYLQILSSIENQTCEEGSAIAVFVAVYEDDGPFNDAVAEQRSDWETYGSCDHGIEMWGNNQILSMYGIFPALLTNPPEEDWSEEEWAQWQQEMEHYEEPSRDDLQAVFNALQAKHPGMESPC